MNDKSTESLTPKSSGDDNLFTEEDRWMSDSIRMHLDSKVDELDFNVVSKLSAARHRALAHETEYGSNAGFFQKRFGAPVLLGGVAVMALAFFLGSQFIVQPNLISNGTATQLTQADLIEDMNMLSASEDLEFFQSMEFLEWMESNSG